MRSVILCGFKGCGKSTFGKQLAEEWDWPFIDTDTLIDVEPRELWLREGEEGFRARERDVVAGLDLHEPTVVATGGGTLMDPENVDLLAKKGKIVHLVATPEVCWDRIRKQGLPPFLHGSDPYRAFMKMYEERLKHYQTIAEETWELPHGE
jgi:shikimate kinase